ncbi:MAG TPA: hypothetical protein VGM25_06470 [Caulobacteraceae bacterium]|jgi:hypothetical protein
MGARRKTRPALRLRVIAEAGEARAEALALTRRLDETARLELARGGTVEREGGRLRLTSRDGLQTLYERGGLEQPDYEAGLMYRRCFETLAAGPRSNLNRDFASGVRGFGETGADGFAELRALRAEQLARWEALAGTGRQLWVLRLVAGQGRTVNSLGSGGSARLANTKALVEVLRAIAMERGLRRWELSC